MDMNSPKDTNKPLGAIEEYAQRPLGSVSWEIEMAVNNIDNT